MKSIYRTYCDCPSCRNATNNEAQAILENALPFEELVEVAERTVARFGVHAVNKFFEDDEDDS
jgi:hypothetical protein